MAWLAATPKPPAGSTRAKKGLGANVTRAEQMKQDGTTPEMPPNPFPHIINRLIEIGLTEAAGMGLAPLSWTTLANWSALTGVELSSWEARLLRHLSMEYLAESRRAEEETCPPPWRVKVTAREIETEAARLRMVLGQSSV
jgi:hypothetical protein